LRSNGANRFRFRRCQNRIVLPFASEPPRPPRRSAVGERAYRGGVIARRVSAVARSLLA
jgi:hypothetical protein